MALKVALDAINIICLLLAVNLDEQHFGEKMRKVILEGAGWNASQKYLISIKILRRSY